MANKILGESKEYKVIMQYPITTLSEIASNYRCNRLLNATPGLKVKSKFFRR